MALVGWLHGALLGLLLWAARLLGRSLWNTVGALLALLGEEVRRYLGLTLWGVVIFLFGKAVMNFAPPNTKTPLVLVVLGLVVVWGLAVVRAVRFTRQNNLIRVRNRMAFKELRSEVGRVGRRLDGIRGGVVEGVARRTRGTRFGGLFRVNRDAAADEQAQRDIAAQREAEERHAEAERVAAERAARERRSRWAEGQRRPAVPGGR